MATVDAATAGTAHGTLTPNAAEVISFGRGGRVEVLNRGATVMYGQYGVTDLTIAGQGTEAIPPGESVVFTGDSGTAGTICLKSTAAVDYSISRYDLTREGGGSGGSTSGTVELGATTLAALESITSDTEFPAAAALSDTTANPTAPMVGAALMYWDGTQWVRWQRFVKELTTATPPTHANVSASASSVAIFASNTNARQRSVHNDSTSAMYLKMGTGASATSYMARLDADAFYVFEKPLYTGAVEGIWVTATGTARTVEWT